MRAAKQPLAPLLLALAVGCGQDGGDSDTDAGTDTATTGGTESTSSGATTGAGAQSLCDAAPTYSEPGGDEYMQWVINGAEYTSLPPVGGAYFFNSYLSVALYSSDLASSLNFGSINAFPDGISAGTYMCDDSNNMFVNGGALGLASAQAAGSSCVLSFTEDVTDGGRIVGSLSARLVDLTGNPAGCVDARFALTDAAP